MARAARASQVAMGSIDDVGLAVQFATGTWCVYPFSREEDSTTEGKGLRAYRAAKRREGMQLVIV